MKKFLLLSILSLFICFGFSSCTSESDATSEEMMEDPMEDPLLAETRLNVSYGSSAQQVYDLYLPANRTSEKTKVVILVHGGGWVEGDKADMSDFVGTIQQFHPDHAVVNMNYVLATGSIPAFPNQYEDVQSVIDQLTLQKEELQILPEFGLIGTSAGAHISLMYDYVYDTNDVVKFVCDIVGPTDFTDPFYTNDPGFNILLQFLVDESAYPAGTDYAVANSPALQVNSSSSPSILFYGDMDPLVPLTNGQLLDSNLTASQIDHAFTIYSGGHGNWDPASLLDLQLQLTNFINTHLAIL